MKRESKRRLPRLRTILVLLFLLTFAGCIALGGGNEEESAQAPPPAPEPEQPPAAPNTTINIDGLTAEDVQQLQESGLWPGGQSVEGATQYAEDYLTALKAANTSGEVEWGIYKNCRAQAIHADALKQAQESRGRTSVEDVLLAKLEAISEWGESAAQGKRWYNHEAAEADAFRDPASDAIILLMLLEEMTLPNPSIPLCQQDPKSFWSSVRAVLNAGADLTRETVPVRLVPQEVSNAAEE